MKVPKVTFLDGAIEVTSNDVDSDHILDDGSLTMEPWNEEKAFSLLRDVESGTSVVCTRLVKGHSTIGLEDQWDEYRAAERRLYELSASLEMLIDMVGSKLDSIHEELMVA